MNYEFENAHNDDISGDFIRSAFNDFALKNDGINFSYGETAIHSITHKQKNHVSLKSIFLLMDRNKNIIASRLTMEQVKPISEHIKGSIIKFDRMVNAGGYENSKIQACRKLNC